jgi:hypothetical protein
LTYSLVNPPAGAQIGPTSGVLTWTPSSAPATNNFIIVVTDNGTPSLAATQSFTVTVVAPPTLANFALNNGNLTFTWMSAPGQFYQVEFKADLTDAQWIPIGAVMMGTGGPLNFTNSVTSSPRGFYRLRVLTSEQAMVSPPILNGQVQGSSQFVLAWPTLPGQRFQVEATTNLAPVNWIALGAPLTATGGVLKYTNNLSDASRRFYRLALLQ